MITNRRTTQLAYILELELEPSSIFMEEIYMYILFLSGSIVHSRLGDQFREEISGLFFMRYLSFWDCREGFR